jgi:hypothetical protein
MGIGLVSALTIPGLAVLLVVLAVLERTTSEMHGRSRVDLGAGVAHPLLPPR